jgi:hypothetical protein
MDNCENINELFWRLIPRDFVRDNSRSTWRILTKLDQCPVSRCYMYVTGQWWYSGQWSIVTGQTWLYVPVGYRNRGLCKTRTCVNLHCPLSVFSYTRFTHNPLFRYTAGYTIKLSHSVVYTYVTGRWCGTPDSGAWSLDRGLCEHSSCTLEHKVDTHV